ncbi:GAF domain-containing protein [Kineococcus aurantiacus]|uniref:GAF domain-containing protein n=1 Tax=Kineococcus aurantiacus TaxID=37633 RepID=UPI0031E17E2E
MSDSTGSPANSPATAPETTITRPDHAGENAPGFEVVEAAARAGLGVRLFTVLAWDDERAALQRIHTSHPEEYPVGGEKFMPREAPWPQQVLVRAEPYLGRTPAEVAAVFADWPTIEALGCGSTLNVPVVDAGRTLGSLSLLDVEGHYDELSIPRALRLADLAREPLRAWHTTRSAPTATTESTTNPGGTL